MSNQDISEQDPSVIAQRAEQDLNSNEAKQGYGNQSDSGKLLQTLIIYQIFYPINHALNHRERN